MLDPHKLAQSPSTAPALNRGLALLAALGVGGQHSLESLAGRLSLPKASVFRLLSTLQEIGLVRKTPEKAYEALCVLRPLGDPAMNFREGVKARMTSLCAETGCTIEWYEASSEGMKLLHQVNPETELRVQAGPGFLREWQGELDAVARLGRAFSPLAGSLREPTAYVSNGVLKSLSATKARALVKEAKQNRWALDLIFNTNGVRRVAAAAIERDRFHGVLALAEAFHFAEQSHTDFHLEKLRSALNSLPRSHI